MPELDYDAKKSIHALANKIAQSKDSDVVILNFGIESGFDLLFLNFLNVRKNKRPNLFLILITEGGDADAAYRIGRYLQDNYIHIAIVVAGWCKSAGTLICVAANELIMCDAGELGPLDVQIAKSDELGERSSGLAVEAALEKLQEESFKLFSRFLHQIKNEIGARVTFRTAADMSSQLVIGLMSGIFDKVDPLAVGEDYRSNLIAEEYAIRLNLKGRNLSNTIHGSSLQMLVRGYPSHRFAIDREEVSKLFKRVSSPDDALTELINLLGGPVMSPRNANRSQSPHLEYLNNDPGDAEGSSVEEAPADPPPAISDPDADRVPRSSADELPGGVPEGSEQNAQREPSR